ncbi:MAG: EamA family transporter [Acidimicrobiales bacterium]
MGRSHRGARTGRYRGSLSPIQRELTLGVLFVVLSAGVLHAVWNAVTKAIEDRLIVFAWIGVALTVSGAVALPFTGLPARAALFFLIASVGIHVVYDLALINAYRLGSFNQMYPLARGTAPLLVAFGAAVLAGEHLGGVALAGVIVLAGGLVSLVFSAGRLDQSELPGLAAAILTGVTIAAYSLVDGLGVRRSHGAFAYMALLCLLEGPVFIAVVAGRRSPREWVHDRIALRGLSAGFLSVIAYGAVLWAQARAPLAEVAALRETGVISAAIIGALFFKEGFGYRRLGAAVLVALGVVLMSL